MKKALFVLSLLLVTSVASAQPGPGAFTTLVTTNTGATSLCVGCAIGVLSPTANSGMIVQTITLPSGAPSVTTNKLYAVGGSLFYNGIGLATGSSVSGTTGTISKFLTPTSLGDSLLTESGTTVSIGGTALSLSGVITDTAFGAHSVTAGGAGVQSLTIRNTTAGTGNVAYLALGNDTSAVAGFLETYSSTYSTSGPNIADSVTLGASNAGGITLYAGNAAGPIRFFSGGAAEHARIHASGGVSIGNTTDPGAGLLSVTGFGLSNFTSSGIGSNAILIGNTLAGTGNAASLNISSDVANQTILQSLSSTFTTNSYQVQGSTVLLGQGAGGMSLIAFNGAGAIRFYSGGTSERMRVTPSGGLIVGATTDIGAGIIAASQTVYAGTATQFVKIDATGGLTATNGAGTTLVTLDVTSGLQLGVGPTAQVHPTNGFFMSTWPTTASAANAHVGNSDSVRLVTSLRAAKHDITPIAVTDATRTVMGLQAVLYQSAVDTDQRQWAGFIADDVAQVNPILAVYDEQTGSLQSVTYDRVPAFLLPVVQDQQRRIEALERALTASSRR